jgi:alpha-glucosidase
MEAMETPWWRGGIIYQVYPRSFLDSNGDGIGDLKGVAARLDYLKDLGATAVWLSPIYPSPMADFGYDISDHCDIDPVFGTMADFDDLLGRVHAAGMKLILDFVPNHTSDRHPWFLESRSSRDNPKRDWYMWHDARPGGDSSGPPNPPNNWLAQFGGSAWEWDEVTGQYYYHAFLREQPDLNWRNPEVRKAMLDTMRFWLDRGVDGFRVDAMSHMIKDANLRDNPLNPDYHPRQSDYDRQLPVHSADQPEVHDVVRMMRKVLDGYPERMMVGEVYLPINRMMVYYGTDEDRGVHLPFNFQLIHLPWDAGQIAAAVAQYEGALPGHGWPNWVLGNHDQPRVASRVGAEQARVAAMLLLTLRGTPTLYYGDELGMRDVAIPFGEQRDPQGINMPDRGLSRDPARTPMPWDSSEKRGFTTGTPWLRLDRYHPEINAGSQRNDDHSLFALYRRLIELRGRSAALSRGNYLSMAAPSPLLAYMREAKDERFLVVLNLSHRPASFPMPDGLCGKVEVSVLPEREGEEVAGVMDLEGDEGLVIALAPQAPSPNVGETGTLKTSLAEAS